MADGFYDRQINKLESSDKLREYNWLINDYLKTTWEDAKIIKDLIIKKATSELNFRELMALKDTLSEKWQNEVGKNKMKLYELTAWLYNNTNLSTSQINEPNNNQRFSNNQDVYNENIPPFEIAWWRITKRVLWFDGIKEKTYEVIGWESEYLWNWKYRIYLESSRNIWKYGRSSSNDSIVLSYRGWNTIQIFDSDWERKIWIVRIQNSSEIYENWNMWNGRYDRRIQKRNSFVSFEIKEYGSKIELELSLNGR